MDIIGKSLDEVVSLLDNSKEEYVILNNNHNVCGDRVLVTNFQKKDNIVYITTGEFIFDVKGNSNAEKI